MRLQQQDTRKTKKRSGSLRREKPRASKGSDVKKTTRTMQPTKEQAKQLAALDAIRDEDIDLSDIPEQGARTDWVRGLMYRPVMRAISIRLPAPDLALARQLALRKGLPYQTYIKRLLHDALDRERVSGLR
jgi:predicted DNA binding CopG/RHH family protein